MLDIKWIREHQEQVQLIAEQRGLILRSPKRSAGMISAGRCCWRSSVCGRNGTD